MTDQAKASMRLRVDMNNMFDEYVGAIAKLAIEKPTAAASTPQKTISHARFKSNKRFKIIKIKNK